MILPDIFDKILKENINTFLKICHVTKYSRCKKWLHFSLSWWLRVKPKASSSWIYIASDKLISLKMKIFCLLTLFSSDVASSGRPARIAWSKSRCVPLPITVFTSFPLPPSKRHVLREEGNNLYVLNQALNILQVQ